MIRTRDPFITSEVLYRLSYNGIYKLLSFCKNKAAAYAAADDQSGNRTRVYAVRGRRLDRLTNWPYKIEAT